MYIYIYLSGMGQFLAPRFKPVAGSVETFEARVITRHHGPLGQVSLFIISIYNLSILSIHYLSNQCLGSGSTRITFIWLDPDPLHETWNWIRVAKKL